MVGWSEVLPTPRCSTRTRAPAPAPPLRGEGRKVILSIGVQLLVERRLLVDHRIESIELTLDRGDLALSFRHRGGEPIGRPVRFLAGVGRLRARSWRLLRDRSHELEAIGELPRCSRRRGARRSATRSRGTPGRPAPRAATRLLSPCARRTRVAPAPPRACVRSARARTSRRCTARPPIRTGVETRELVLGRLHLPGGGRRERSQGERGEDMGRTNTTATASRAICPVSWPRAPWAEKTKAPSPEPSPEATHASVGRQTPALPRGGTREADRSGPPLCYRCRDGGI